MSKSKIRAAILGASGYTGADLVRLLAHHPHVEIVLMTAERKAGQPLAAVYPHLGRLELPNLIGMEEVEWAGVELDVVFCCLPHATSQEVIKGLFHATHDSLIDDLISTETLEDFVGEIRDRVRVVDLSADFRLTDPQVYADWYGRPHQAPEMQNFATYGLTELNRDAIRDAALVACPGCYPTAALLSLVPPLKDGLIKPEDIIIDAKSGVTGAGRSLKENLLFAEVSEAAHPYGIASHRHSPEIEQELGKAAGLPLTVNFTPHLLPMNRGELETIYVKLTDGRTAADVKACLLAQYAGERFVHVYEDELVPATRHVRGSNHCVINVFDDRVPGRAIIVAAIDNLVKGSSGQALQNMNVMFGLEETLGLEQEALFP